MTLVEMNGGTLNAPGAFNKCENLANIKLTDVRVESYDNGTYSQYTFNSDTGANVEGGWTLTITGGDLGYCAFRYCTAKNLVLNNVTIAENQFPFYYAGPSTGMNVTINGGNIGSYAFNCSNVNTLTCHDTSLGYRVFKDCNNLETATL